MRFWISFSLFVFLHCTHPKLDNQSEFGTESFWENQFLLCLTGKISDCRETAVPVCKNCRFFSTSTTYTGARGGISGADAICMNDPKKPTSPARAVFKAFLADDVNRIACISSDCLTGGASENKNWILKPNTSYYRAVDGGNFAITNSAGIFTAHLQHAESPTITTPILTGFSTGWTSVTNHCNRWSDGTGTSNAGVAANSVSLPNPSIGNCSSASIIFCVEQ
ncbi:DUF1554 domain-containing protein [Leptospira sp. 2 VSF19]|uniref:DUF1554 domain-containing protein n=1 Tax=Leptospira soteropolitanensis TaxID=2950025 RepID=A0AAW5VDB7_9LEPT|nr:DUF1554 domain-containing protein [Leptospira soteropolitanensis]MCW7491672.1 DUF1554 domain-containing protein [Leptospira soteropolitanensis]MCW7499256.1 DUF1554 domain-containing protein [Leptospira soteropolitanensis]MCW7521152.1 DUF1554 domain-containing protein [Leptospira soteropolitanensis]MCW7525360.1 DUF1554 domain-containing protein [Leptospira soteropolitanensis]MCW7529227.1 DUF1554 domain-containing protein [Leptospira soteropolitanensis]